MNLEILQSVKIWGDDSKKVHMGNNWTYLFRLQTDHDPRNPAYIATQGPLPHTVADFWQVSVSDLHWSLL